MAIPGRRLIATLAVGAASLAASAPAQTIFSKLESAPGWSACGSKSCAGGAGTKTFSMQQNVSSPSLDGAATEFRLGATRAFADALWWKHVTTDSTISNFTLDLDQYLADPGAAQAIEYGSNQHIAGGWYKFSTQCSFAKGVWRVWNSAKHHWVATSAPCQRPLADTWQHLTFEWARVSGQAVFVSITVDGQKSYINQSFSPQRKSSSSGAIGVHYQLDGTRQKTSYSSFIDQMRLTVW